MKTPNAMSMRTLTLATVFALSAGCAIGTDPAEFDEGTASDALRHGTTTSSRPEVGSLLGLPAGLCTGTLIAPQAVLSAAHCVQFGTVAVGSASRGTFRIDAVRGTTTYTVDGYRSFGTQLGAGDILLLHLSIAVPATVATPAPFTGNVPLPGAWVVSYGYGYSSCTFPGDGTRIEGEGSGVKRVYGFNWGTDPHDLCGGDSGGPLFREGTIFAINDATTRTGGDYYTRLTGYVTPIRSQITAWQNPPPASVPTPPPSGGDAGAPPTGTPPPGSSGASGTCGCRSGVDNYCLYGINVADCAMTAAGGYCDPNGDGNFSDADWVRGYNAYQRDCGAAGTPPPPPPPPPPADSCACRGGVDNFCLYGVNVAGCAMTAPGGYCDPNGDGSFSDADWVRGYNEFRSRCP